MSYNLTDFQITALIMLGYAFGWLMCFLGGVYGDLHENATTIRRLDLAELLFLAWCALRVRLGMRLSVIERERRETLWILRRARKAAKRV